MNECYQQNLDIISRRWPDLFNRLQAISPELDTLHVLEGKDNTLLINGVQLTSRHNRQAEAELQAKQISAMQPVIELYGTGLGDVQQQLLQRKQLKKLNVHILNENIFLLVIQLLDQQFWLDDPRVTLQFAADHTEIKVPFIALPAELILTSDINLKIKERLVSETDLTFINQRISQEHIDYGPRIEANKIFWHSDQPVQQLYRTVPPQQEVFVIATGPSLEHHFDYLKQRQQSDTAPIIIAADTALKPLLQHGIVPDYIITLDVRINHKRIFSEPVPPQVSLVYFPLANHDVLSNWPGKRYIALNETQAFDSIRHQLKADNLYIHGSVIHPALDLAVKMGAKNVVLFGADFSFANNKTHAGWADGALGLGVDKTSDWTLNGYGERVKTLRNLKTYLIGVERYISHLPGIAFYNTSKAGAVISGTVYYPELVK